MAQEPKILGCEKDGDSILELQMYDPETCRNWTVILSELELRVACALAL